MVMVFLALRIELDCVQQMIEKSGLVNHLFMGPWSVLCCACGPSKATTAIQSSKLDEGQYMGLTLSGWATGDGSILSPYPPDFTLLLTVHTVLHKSIFGL